MIEDRILNKTFKPAGGAADQLCRLSRTWIQFKDMTEACYGLIPLRSRSGILHLLCLRSMCLSGKRFEEAEQRIDISVIER